MSYFLVVLSTQPGSAFTLLNELKGRPFRVVLVGPVDKAERGLLQSQGWHHMPGGLATALKVHDRNAALARLLVRATDTYDEIMEELGLATHTPQKPPNALRKAAFLIPTHHRPEILPHVLELIRSQRVPEGWTFDVLVGGEPSDPAKGLVDSLADVTFHVIDSPLVTTKLNRLAELTDAELILMADDDDLQPVNRLEEAIKAYEKGMDWSGVGRHFFCDLATGKIARWDGRGSRGLVGTSISVRRDLFLAVQGYPNVAKDKDGHLSTRLQARGAVFGDLSQELTLVCLSHGSNIHKRPFPDLHQTTKRGWFEVTGMGSWTVAEVPPEAKAILAHLVENRDLVTASLASIPSREPLLRDTVASLLPQVDKLNVYLNGYAQTPSFLDHPKIEVARSQDHGDRGDAGKFFWSDQIQGYVLTCDDDILYPPDYVSQLVEGIERHNRKAVVSFHGATLKGVVQDYYTCRVQHHCRMGQKEDIGVHILGTGVMGYHSSTLEVKPEFFEIPNMADIWMGYQGQVQKIPFKCLRRRAGWIQSMKAPHTIYDSSRRQDGSARDTAQKQTEVVQRWRKWRIHETRQLVIAIKTFNRPRQVMGLLRDIQEELRSFEGVGQVLIYDDASTEDYSEVQRFAHAHGFRYTRADQNHGKQRHWEWMSRVYQDLKGLPADYYFSLPDDIRLAPGAITEAIRLWHTIEDPQKVSLSLAVISNRAEVPCWTGIMPTHKGEVVHTGWVDGMCLFNRTYLEALNYQVPPIGAQRWRRDPLLGSGVGQVTSQLLVRKDLHMYRVPRSLVRDQFGPSVMNLQARLRDPVVYQDRFGLPEVPPHEMRAVKEATRVYQMPVIPGDHIGKTHIAGAFYEIGLLRAIRQLNLKGVYVDVGAFTGNHTLWFAKECAAEFVIAFEPQPDVYRLLEKTIQVNGLPARGIHGAVHNDWARTSLISGPEGNAGMARLQAGGEVPCYRLDDVLEGVNVALIKIDVEGCEPSVLQSAVDTLKRCRPVLVTEAATPDQLQAIAQLLPDYEHGRAYNRTPTYIWMPK